MTNRDIYGIKIVLFYQCSYNIATPMLSEYCGALESQEGRRWKSRMMHLSFSLYEIFFFLLLNISENYTESVFECECILPVQKCERLCNILCIGTLGPFILLSLLIKALLLCTRWGGITWEINYSMGINATNLLLNCFFWLLFFVLCVLLCGSKRVNWITKVSISFFHK